MAEIYDLLQPYLDNAETYNDLIRAVFQKDPDTLNRIYQKITGHNPSSVDGVTIIFAIIETLKFNDFGAFVLIMKRG